MEPANEVALAADLASMEKQFSDPFTLVSEEDLFSEGDYQFLSLEELRERELDREADEWLAEHDG